MVNINKLAMLRKEIITDIDSTRYDSISKKEKKVIDNIKEDILNGISFRISDNSDNTEFINELYTNINSRKDTSPVFIDILEILKKYKVV